MIRLLKIVQQHHGIILCYLLCLFFINRHLSRQMNQSASTISRGRHSLSAENIDSLCKCITAGFFANAAKYHPTGEYRTVRDDHVLHIHPTSVLFTESPPKWVVFNEVIQTTKDYMRDVTTINPDWLCELAPDFYQFGTEREIAAKRARLDDG